MHNNIPFKIPVVTTRLSFDSSIYHDKPILTTMDAIEAVEKHITDLASESFYCIFSDLNVRPLCVANVGIGNQKNTNVSVREIVRTALLSNASYVTLIHNHPSECKDIRINKKMIGPSKEDIKTTMKIAKALENINVALLDSIFVERPVNGKYISYSMRDKKVFHKKMYQEKEENISLEDIQWANNQQFDHSKDEYLKLNNIKDITEEYEYFVGP